MLFSRRFSALTVCDILYNFAMKCCSLAVISYSEYARPHGGFSPVTLQRSSALGIPPQCIDPMIHYQINSMYAPGARER